MNKTDEALAKILTTLADKFGTTVDHLYAIMIKQALIDGIECILAIVIFAIAFTISAIRLNKIVKESNANKARQGWEWDDSPCLAFITVFLGVLFTVFLIFGGLNAINAFFNPEYYALKEIISK